MRVQLTPSANADLDGVYDYIAKDSLDAAEGMVARILSALEQLRTHPKLGRAGHPANTRELVIRQSPYIAVYQIEHGVIRVVRIRHGAQDWRSET